MSESRATQADRIAGILADHQWHPATDLPGSRRRAYSIVIDWARQGHLEQSTQQGIAVWRMTPQRRTI